MKNTRLDSGWVIINRLNDFPKIEKNKIKKNMDIRMFMNNKKYYNIKLATNAKEEILNYFRDIEK